MLTYFKSVVYKDVQKQILNNQKIVKFINFYIFSKRTSQIRKPE